mgnify:CR=1 FL=1
MIPTRAACCAVAARCAVSESREPPRALHTHVLSSSVCCVCCRVSSARCSRLVLFAFVLAGVPPVASSGSTDDLKPRAPPKPHKLPRRVEPHATSPAPASTPLATTADSLPPHEGRPPTSPLSAHPLRALRSGSCHRVALGHLRLKSLQTPQRGRQRGSTHQQTECEPHSNAKRALRNLTPF